MEDHIGPFGDQRGGHAPLAEIGDNRLGARRAFRDGAVHHIHQGHAGDGLAAQCLVAGQAFHQLASDHAAGAGDENLHVVFPL